MKSALRLGAALALVVCTSATVQSAPASPAEMISQYRLQHGGGRVISDPVLDRIAQQQAAAMAAKDALDHDVLGPFGTRIAPARSGRAAENIAYGYDSFAKTLDQWIASPDHRRNLLLHDASRVGVAKAVSPTTRRTYWAMEIAGGYERRPTRPAKGQLRAQQACRMKVLGLCL